MSYIRCGSNPERLYVFHSTGGYIDFSTPENIGNSIIMIRANIFYRFIKLMPRWDAEFKRMLPIVRSLAKTKLKILHHFSYQRGM